MREFTIRLRFSKHCLGNVKVYRQEGEKRRPVFLFLRSPDRRVQFLPSWWQAVFRRAAAILCRHHKEVDKIRVAPEVEGAPRPIPEQLFKVYHDAERFSRYEAFWPGDVISLTAVAPEAIPDADFEKLLELAGRYYGMSPGRPNEYGFFSVVDVRPVLRVEQQAGKESEPAA